ncbi:Hypothetical_protein [Hexamita inflata]|uniref:Hypothetical_protein n=1 Tax=Hexamita inflata TaxID=28002 RepID=A0ABP1J5W9_9EUKA
MVYQQNIDDNEENFKQYLKSTPNSRFSIQPKQTTYQYSPKIIILLGVIIVYSSPTLRLAQLCLSQIKLNKIKSDQFSQADCICYKQLALEAQADVLNNFYQITRIKLKSQCFQNSLAQLILMLKYVLKSFGLKIKYLLLQPQK